MDVLRILAAPSLEVRRKTLDIVLDLASSRNIGDAVTFLVKELAKTNRYYSNRVILLTVVLGEQFFLPQSKPLL